MCASVIHHSAYCTTIHIGPFMLIRTFMHCCDMQKGGDYFLTLSITSFLVLHACF